MFQIFGNLDLVKYFTLVVKTQSTHLDSGTSRKESFFWIPTAPTLRTMDQNHWKAKQFGLKENDGYGNHLHDKIHGVVTDIVKELEGSHRVACSQLHCHIHILIHYNSDLQNMYNFSFET